VTQALAIPNVGLPSASDWTTLRAVADVVLKSGLLPTSIKSAETALTIMLKAREIGIPPLYGLNNIVVVQGKPVCSAELMLALIYRDHGDNALIVEESTALECRVSYRRRSWDRARNNSFTIDDARTAQLLGNQTWTKYPAAMLRARCISATARMAFPDSISGMYTPEELGAAVEVSDDGTVEIVHPVISPLSVVQPVPRQLHPPQEPVPAYEVPPPDEVRYTNWDALIADDDRDPALMAQVVTGSVPIEPPVDPRSEERRIRGLALVAECEALAARLKVAGITPSPMPEPRTTLALTSWIARSTATLDAHHRATGGQPPLIAPPPPTAYDAMPPGRGGRGR
jgi:hypothetical protein